MAAPPYNSLMTAVVNMMHEAQPLANVLNFAHNLNVTDDNIGVIEGQLGVFVRDFYVERVVPLCAAAVSFVSVACQAIVPVKRDAVLTPFNGGTVGTGAGDSLPTFNVQLLRIRSGEGLRHGRGRINFPAPPEGGTLGSNLTGDQLELLGNAGDDLVATFGVLSANDFTLGILARMVNKEPVPPAIANFHPLRSTQAVQLVGVQRRRKVGVHISRRRVQP